MSLLNKVSLRRLDFFAVILGTWVIVTPVTLASPSLDCWEQLLMPRPQVISKIDGGGRVRLGTQKLTSEIEARRSRVAEFQKIREEAQKRGLRVWLFGGTAAAFSHYVKWDLLREKGDTRFRAEQFDYDLTHIFRSTQDIALVVDVSSAKAQSFEDWLKIRFPDFFPSKVIPWEVRSLREPKGDQGALLGDPVFMLQHSDSQSTGMIELTDPPLGESFLRDLRQWEVRGDSQFLKDLEEGMLTYYYSPDYASTARASSGKNPPIFSVIRALTKVFQYDLSLREADLILLQKEITHFQPKRDLKDSDALAWIERNGIQLLQHAMDLESAWNTLEQLGLRKKLISISNRADSIGSLAWWMSKEPLRSKPVGLGSGKTAQELGLSLVAHETRDFGAFESMTRSYTGAPNVFISRVGVQGEYASYGEGFYTANGGKGGRGTGITLRFQVDPKAREGTDFLLKEFEFNRVRGKLPIGSYVIWLNKRALRLRSEGGLPFSVLEYFEFLDSGQELPKGELILQWDLKRRVDRLLVSGEVSSQDLDRLRLIVLQKMKTHLEEARFLLQEWLRFESVGLERDPKEFQGLADTIVDQTYEADPARSFEKLIEITQNTVLENYFLEEWIPTQLKRLKKDFGNRALERLIFSKQPLLQTEGLEIIKSKNSKKRDLFLIALEEIFKQGGDPVSWIQSVDTSPASIQQKVSYLSVHPELKSLLTHLQWRLMEPEIRKVSFQWIFDALSQDREGRALPNETKGESFLFHSFTFPPEGLRVALGASPGQGEVMLGEESYEVLFTRSFAIQETPVTQLQWTLIMGYNPSRFGPGGRNDYFANRPVERVSWEEVQKFIGRLNSIDPDYEYRLPTEAESEFASRGGEEAIYPYGDEIRELKNYAWFLESSVGRTHDVAELKPNAYGLYDTLGNVNEWVQDWWSSERSGRVTDPTGPEVGRYRLVRSGCWGDRARRLRCSERGTQGPGVRTDFTGFRLVRIRRSSL